MAKLTPWVPRHIEPVRNGFYDCVVRIPGGLVTFWRLEWDGIGFKVPMPMIVREWRGLTKSAAHQAAKEPK